MWRKGLSLGDGDAVVEHETAKRNTEMWGRQCESFELNPTSSYHLMQSNDSLLFSPNVQ